MFEVKKQPPLLGAISNNGGARGSHSFHQLELLPFREVAHAVARRIVRAIIRWAVVARGLRAIARVLTAIRLLAVARLAAVRRLRPAATGLLAVNRLFNV